MMAFLGIDYGGTATKLILGDPHPGTAPVALAQAQIPSPHGENAGEELVAKVRSFSRGHSIDAVGVSVPGLVAVDGQILAAVNQPWLKGRYLAREFSQLFMAPASVVNDGYAAALAEADLGAGRDFSDAFIIALGTGIAAKHVINGVVRVGAHQGAGEIGHLVSDPGGYPCSCGQHGCLETVIGGPHLARQWREAVAGLRDGAREDYLAGRELAELTAANLTAAARAGMAEAREITDRAAKAFAHVLLSIVTTVDPELIVIGGGVAQAYEELIRPAIAELEQRATFQHLPQILAAALGPWAGAWGAALSAAQTVAGDAGVAARKPGAADAAGRPGNANTTDAAGRSGDANAAGAAGTN